ncbi:MAG: aldehyde dehydrogenase family protein [Acidobacteriota bacterium]
MAYTGKMLIAGNWREAAERFDVRSPWSGELLAKVSSATASELDEAIVSAVDAAHQMRKPSRYQLAKGLRAIADGIEARKEKFTKTIVDESAKPRRYARGEVERAIATFSTAAGEAERFVGEVVPVDAQASGRGKTGWTLRVPRGVIYGITPFNFPLNLVAHKVAPALASGNSIIIKPSPRTPLTSLLLGEVFLASGLPKSALQVVPIDVELIPKALADDRIAMISFTGSAPVGWDIKSKAAKKAVALELGGNASVIIDETADIASSVSKNLVGAFAYSGQVCISVQRIYIHEKLFDDWVSSFVVGARTLKKGDPASDDTLLSVMIDQRAVKRVSDWVSEAVDNGAEILCGGTLDGSMLDATVLTNTDPEMHIVSEEAFGPVVVVEKFSDFREAVDKANHGKYGLQAGVFSQDLANVNYAAENLEYGGVIVNDVPTFRVDNMPYGGVKDSGFGREGVRYAMEEMTEQRLIVLDR